MFRDRLDDFFVDTAFVLFQPFPIKPPSKSLEIAEKLLKFSGTRQTKTHWRGV